MPDRVPYHRPATDEIREHDPARVERRWYSSKRWMRTRKAFLAKHPLCSRCSQAGRVEAAVIVHHIVERLDDPRLAWEWSNFEPLCRSCHGHAHGSQEPR